MLVIGLCAGSISVQPAFAQIFSEPPPPVPPAAVPGAPGPALNLAPSSGGLAPPPPAPSGIMPPPVAAPNVPTTIMPAKPSGQGVLALAARLGKG